MGAIRIVALDLDGTLLDSEKRLSEVNRDALARAAEKGVEIVPTTGRFFGMMPPAVRDLPFVRYAITINGAQVYDRETDTAIVRDEIPLDMALGVMEVLDRYDVIYDCYRQNWGWMTAALQEKAADYATNEHYLRMVREFRKPVPELKAHLRETAANGDVQKIMLFAANRERSAAIDRLRGLSDEIAARFPEIKVTASTWNNLELNIRTAHKGNALRRFAEHLGLTLENCMAFGDGMNDFTMVEAAGLGISMANAEPEVKRVAKDMVPSNDEDGVAKGIEKWIFSR
ncbi:MAG: HAD family phosphatase [Kiritimatiellae bacterium]|nr:HAD family phosphatase [Kiritimatiellia bacterium]